MTDVKAEEEGKLRARKRVKAVGALLIGRSNKKTLANFDENTGSGGYVAWRRQLLVLTATAGADFLAALRTQREVRVAGDYSEEGAIVDDAGGAPGLTMPQIRQEVLLALVRGLLIEGGESLALLRGCRHAGGYVVVEGDRYLQAMMLLDKRWLDGGIATIVAEEAGFVYRLTWPAQLSVEAYHAHYIVVVARAAMMGLSLVDNSVDAINTRWKWWHVLSSPPL